MIDNIYIQPNSFEFEALVKRPKLESSELNQLMKEIFNLIKSNGDAAVNSFSKQFDDAELESFEVRQEEVEQARSKVSDELKNALNIAQANIQAFHKAQVSDPIHIETSQGVICTQRSVPIEKVGLYIPGGSAPLFSTVLMLAIPAKIAGCKEVILCSPPDTNGDLHPAILYAAELCGITSIYKVGGAQAIAAMSVGTETIPKVSKIFGPGNQYVMAAKMYAQKYGVSMDMPAGPSELLVYGDDTSIPEFIAADLLSQAEHGADSQVILVANTEELTIEVNKEIAKQIEGLSRKEIAKAALRHSKAIIIPDMNDAFSFINEYAPEHLIIASEYPEEYVDLIINAGSVFLGNNCPESAGDYASGTNHTLPTNGWAKSYNGVNVDSFQRKITFQSITEEGILALGHTIAILADNEGLDGHSEAARIRIRKIKGSVNG